MAVEDTWTLKDGKTPSRRHGRGLRYRVRWHGKARSFRTKGEADRYWLRVRTEQPVPEVPVILVGELVDRWLATKRGLSPRGYRACLDASAHVREAWGDEFADRITRHDVESWLAEMPYGGSLKSKALQCISGGFKTWPAIENPCAGVTVGQEQRREARFLSVDELHRLGDATGHYRAMVLFLGTAGPRIGEVVALDVGDIDAARGRARVWQSSARSSSTKGRQARDVPVTRTVLDLLDLDRPRDAPLFVTPRGRRVLVDNWRARVFAPAAESCGLEMTVHDLRHTAASLAIAQGADVKAVQRMLGHKTATLTMDWYGHLWDKGLDDVSARMDAALRSEMGTTQDGDELAAKRAARRTRYSRTSPHIATHRHTRAQGVRPRKQRPTRGSGA